MKLVSIQTLFYVFLLLPFVSQNVHAQVWTMQQCIDTAQVYNKTLQISRNNIAIGEQKLKEAKANTIPRISANVEYKYYTDLPYQLMPLSTFNPAAPEGQFKEAQFGVPHNINANLQFSTLLYNPQINGSIQTVKIVSELNVLQYQKTEEQIYFEISNLYYNASILHHQLAFTDSNLINADRLLKNMQLLHEQLLVKSTDVSKVKLQLAQLSLQRKNISGKYDQVLNALKIAAGIPMERDLHIEPEINYQKSGEYIPAYSLDARIIKTQNRVLSSELNTLNKSRFLPSLHLVGLYGTTGFGYSKQSTDFLKFYPIGFVGFQFSYPLFNGTVIQRKISQKSFELKNNDLQFNLISEQNSMQIENARYQRILAVNSIEMATEQIELAKTIYEQTLLQQKQGTAGLTDVLLADNALRETQQSYLNAVIEYLKADLELKKLSGNFHP